MITRMPWILLAIVTVLSVPLTAQAGGSPFMIADARDYDENGRQYDAQGRYIGRIDK